MLKIHVQSYSFAPSLYTSGTVLNVRPYCQVNNVIYCGRVWTLQIVAVVVKSKKVKEVDLYSAFIVVPHTQGAQVRITQCYLQITPYLPLPRKHSPDGASPD